MPKIPLDITGRTWTYGVEHELADWDTRKGWKGYGRDPEPNIVNSNGIAADPTLRSYPYGAEINTQPTDDADGQAQQLAEFLGRFPEADANWRCGMHVHIRVPGLATNLPALKKLARYILLNREVYDLIDPLPLPSKRQHPTPTEWAAAKRRYNWMRMSHMTVIPEYRVENQLKVSTLKEFFEAEVPRARTGKPLFHAQPRAAINLRQLLQTDTIEFRHFPQTLDPEEVITAVEWCRDYLQYAFAEQSGVELFDDHYTYRRFPTLDTIYVHWQELRWLRTAATKNKRPQIEAAIQEIIKEDHGREYSRDKYPRPKRRRG